MVPVRSEPTQPVLPSVLPIRLWPREAKVPNASGPLVVAVFPATMVLPRVTVPLALYKPPPSPSAELPLTVQLVSVVAPPDVVQAAAVLGGGVAADRAVGQRGRAAGAGVHAAAAGGGVAADGAVGQRRRAARLDRPPPAGGGVAADGAVGQRHRAPMLYRPPPCRLSSRR